MSNPIIGVTTHGPDEKGVYHTSGFYIDSIRRAGGVPVLVPPGERCLETLIDTVDAFVFTGGGDIDPCHYGGRRDASIYGVNPIRDQSEFTLAKLVIDRDLPTFAICRGMQVFNVLLGGTLIADLESEPPGDVIHRLPKFKPAMHQVKLNGDSRLKSSLGIESLEGASVHHQAIATLAEGAKPVAFSDDGVIEAIEFETILNLTAVQWHPEITAEDDPLQQRLFNQLVSMAIKTKKRRLHAITK